MGERKLKHLINYVYYDPDKINAIIHKSLIEQKYGTQNISEFNSAIYHKYLYNLFVLEFMGYIDKDRDGKMRSEISALISKTDLRNNAALDSLRNKLHEMLYEEDYNKILYLINNYNYDKKKLIEEILNQVYKFDNTTLLKLEKLSDYYYKLGDQKKEHKKAILSLISYIANKIIDVGQVKFNDTDQVDNIFTPCANDHNSIYCSKTNKLIIPGDKLEDLIEIFFYDIVNPIKREYILSSIIINTVQNYFHIKKNPQEEIYIKF